MSNKAQIEVYAEHSDVVEMKVEVNVGAAGVTLEDMCQQLRLLYKELEFTVCTAEKHKVTKSDGKTHKDIPEGYRIYSKHHHAPSMLRAEIEAHTAH